jgi:glycosyltransferase involved in cell wall biosynthesis
MRAQGSVLIVGDGPERQRLTELAKAQGLANVRFVGHLPAREVAACLAAGDVFVLPTLEDVWGLVIGEAMAAGLPILCSKYAGGAQDLVREGVNGHVFDPLNHAQLSASLRDVLEHPEQLKEMGKHSREIIAGFTIDRSISSLAQALRASVER